MSDIYLNTGGTSFKRVPFVQVAASTILSLNLSGVTSAAAKFTNTTPAVDSLSGTMDHLHLKTNVANAFSISGARFSRGGKDYIVKATGEVQQDISPVTGNGTTVGSMSLGQGEVLLDAWAAGGSPDVTNWRALAAAPINGSDTPFATYAITFRVPTAPLRTGSLTVLGTMQDGTTFNVGADGDGIINTTRIKGRVNYTTGVVMLVGVTPSAPAGQSAADVSFLGIPGLTTAYIDLIRQETVRLNAVGFTYLPLDAALLGIDPVRLPSDGRVPIFRSGGFYVLSHKQTTPPATAVNGGTVNVGRTRLSRVRVIGNDNATIQTGYTVDREAGIVTWVDVTGYSQPVRVANYIEDMSQIRDAQINGDITGLKALTHDFPAGSYISSAMMLGDLRARVKPVFDQATWDGITWSDTVVGNPAPATYNDTGFPITVTNRGARTERFALVFKTTLTVDVIGEHVGNLGTYSINTVIAPINPYTNTPYFSVPIEGWGSGWSVGNVLFVPTVGALPTLWIARTVKQGPAAGLDYSFELLARGDIDNPL